MEPALTPPPPAPPAPVSRRRSCLPWLLFVVALALAGLLGWKAYGPEDVGDPVTTTVTALSKHNRLTVFSAQLAPVVASRDSRLFGLVKARQVAVIPARVDYSLDLSKVGKDRLTWDPAGQVMTVSLPQVAVGRPDLDEGNAQYLREGVWIGRDAQEKLTHDNTVLAEQMAAEQAANPVLLDLARSAAREAVRQNISIPLEVAGFGKVKVLIKFDGEPNPM